MLALARTHREATSAALGPIRWFIGVYRPFGSVFKAHRGAFCPGGNVPKMSSRPESRARWLEKSPRKQSAWQQARFFSWFRATDFNRDLTHKISHFSHTVPMGISALLSTMKRCTWTTCSQSRLEAPTVVIQVDYNVTQNTVIGHSWHCLFEASTLTKALNNSKHTVGFRLQRIIIIIIPLHFPSKQAGQHHDFVQHIIWVYSWLH